MLEISINEINPWRFEGSSYRDSTVLLTGRYWQSVSGDGHALTYDLERMWLLGHSLTTRGVFKQHTGEYSSVPSKSWHAVALWEAYNTREISVGNRMNASAINKGFTLPVIFENSLKIARAFRRVQFERILFQFSYDYSRVNFHCSTN